MRVPRFLWVPFELGRPFGAPHEPAFQRRVLTEALMLLERTDGPVVLEDFPDDAPSSDEDAVWACQVYPHDVAAEGSIIDAVLAEIDQLVPWTEGRPAPWSNTGLDRSAMVAHLMAVIDDAGSARDEKHLIETTRLVCDDLRTWYLAAAGNQPGRASASDRTQWFWAETALARLMGEVASALLEHEHPVVRGFARRAIVPRDYISDLVR